MIKSISKYKTITIWLVVSLIILMLQSVGNPMFVIQESNYLGQPFDLRGFAKLFVYLFTYAFAIGAITSIILSKSKSIAIIGLVFIGLTYSIDFFVQNLGAVRGFSVEEMILAASQFQLASNMSVYSTEIILSLLSSLVVVGVMIFIRNKTAVRYTNSICFSLFILSVILVKLSANKVYSILHNSYPAPIKSIAIGIQFLNKKNVEVFRLVDKQIRPNINAQSQKNIIWIVDESATGSYLSVNGYPKKTTPYLDKAIVENSNLVNLGISNSISNCSNTSNLYLRVGMNPNIDFDELNKLPSIISFAKNAGYKVVMLDAQITPGELTNFITPEEVNIIDENISLDRSIRPSNRDREMNMLLFDLLEKSKEKLFVIYIKFGCHWPYLLNFDNQKTVFSPIQPSSATRMIKSNRLLIQNTYLNSIYHNVDQFFNQIVKNIDPSENFVFYTSDHGQSILESETSRTHCSNNVDNIPLNEFSVPLILYSSDIDSLYENGEYSQIQIFSSTLNLMGYRENVVEKYEKSLEQGPIEERFSFITGTGKKIEFK